MPLYDYKCPCGHVDEAMRRYDDRHLTVECPECGQDMVYTISAPHTQKFRHHNKARRDAAKANIGEI